VHAERERPKKRKKKKGSKKKKKQGQPEPEEHPPGFYTTQDNFTNLNNRNLATENELVKESNPSANDDGFN